jgi:hypothetical protein
MKVDPWYLGKRNDGEVRVKGIIHNKNQKLSQVRVEARKRTKS